MKMDVILAIVLILIFTVSIVVNIWSTKISCNEQRLRSAAIYKLYEEIKRHNDNLENK